MFPRILFFFLLGTGSLGLIAQSADQFALDTVSIATARLPQTRAETGRNISILTAQQIELLPARSVDELLRYLPGIEVQSRQGFGGQADVVIRGSTFSQVLFLIDGLRLNDPLTGHFNGYLPVALAEIERIEVLRGAAAAMYGPDAVGGVVHIVTKAFSRAQAAAQEGRVEVLGGSYGLLSAQAGAYWQQPEGWRVGGGLLVNRSAGEPLNDSLRNDFDLRTVSFSLGRKLAPRWELMARTAYDLRTFNARYFYTRSPIDQSREQTRQAWQQVRLTHQGRVGRTELDLGYKMSQDSFLFNPAFPANVHRMHYLNAQLHHNRRLGPGLNLGLGGQVDRRSIRSSDRGDHADLHVGGYALAHWRPAPRWHLTGSLRGDWDENYGFQLLPQLSLSRQGDRLTLRAASGRSIRAGDYTERYISTNLPLVSSGRNLGNPALRAEQAWSHEAGLDWHLGAGLQLRSTAFWRQGTDLIDYVLTPAAAIPGQTNLDPAGEFFFAQNIARLQTRGAEVELRWQQRWGDAWQVDAHAGYTWLQSVNDEPVVSKYLANHARHLLTAYAVVAHRRLRLALNGLYKVRDPDRAPAINAELAPAYTVWNLRAGYHLSQGRLGLHVQVANLFNARYQDILGAQMPGRWWMGGLSWSW